MSIATAISALQSASSDIASAIAAKGVTVPSGSGYDDYATLIASIETGGGGGGDPELPSGYTRKDYIYGNGSALINTGVTGAANWILTAQANSGQTSRYFIGQGTSSGQFFGIMSSGNIGFSTTNTQYTTGVSSSSKFNAAVLFGSDRMAATINQYGVYRNGSVTRTGEYILLGLTTSTTNALACKIWVADAWKGTSMAFHGIPCIRNVDNKAGLYDTVSKTFLTSFGSSDFTAGNDS